MTIKESLKNWLRQYPNFTIDEYIDTEITTSDGYAIVKEPNTVIKKFIDGSQKRTEYYTFVANKITTTESIRKNNDTFLEEFEEWIDNKNFNGEYPELKQNCICDEIAISSSYYMQSLEDKTGQYIFTVAITYRKDLI